ncbi:hypothetical protein [Sediminibacterium sp.]|uniref:hypothetical protein n=1 Tax=Sediminibacterium sp. TaxID=1917865 RepID=UPI002736B3C0|nr:hypothetical protein [Sediminibacterium sp.]MDP3392204.1 hypothetical protein [Sediminibacterium sp.]MDP3566994.1 hypothetical protein [Sediminibacterium sp.]
MSKLLMLVFCVACSFAQLNAQKKVQISIVVTDVHLKYSNKSGTDPRLKFFNKQDNALLNNTDSEGFNCFHLVDFKQTDAMVDYPLKNIEWDLSNGTAIGLKMEAFEKNKKKGNCDFDGSGLFNKDKMHEFGEWVIDLKTIKPGVFSNKMTATTAGGNFSIEYKVKYTLPSADEIATDIASAKYCSNTKVKLTTGASLLPNKEDVLYKWEYQLDGSADWNLLSTTGAPELQVALADVLKAEPMANQKVNTRVSLMVGAELGMPAAKSFVFMPAAPSIQLSDIITNNTCKDVSEGIVTINNIKGFTEKYLLQLKPSDKTVSSTDGTAKFTGVAKGTYQLFLTNDDNNAGACSVNYPVVINEHPKLEEVNKKIAAVTCNGLLDGSVSVTLRGGNPAALNATILPQAGTLTIKNREVVFSGLAAGKYVIQVTDSCNNKIEFAATLTEPVAAKINVTNIVKSSCTETPNGSFTVSIAQGVGPFRYVLIKRDNNKEIFRSEFTNLPTWMFNSLAAGEYSVLVYSNNSDICKPVERKLRIEESVLEVDVKMTKNVSATSEDAKNGVLHFAITDTKLSVQYILTNLVNNQVYSNTTGLFDNIPAGRYALALKRADTNCGDMQKITEIFTITSTPVQIIEDTTVKKDTTGTGGN